MYRVDESEILSARTATIYVNGRFLGRPLTGVERFAMETLRAIDRALGSVDAGERRVKWHILAPAGVKRPDNLKHIGFSTVHGLSGHLWEQVSLAWASRKGVLLNLCNSGPVFHPRSLTVIHDALVFRYPEFFRFSYSGLHRALGVLLARRSTIATVSKFSRGELHELLGIPLDTMAVAPNAADHMRAIAPDFSVLEKLGPRAKSFLLIVGSASQNKNIATALQAFRALNRPDIGFVIVGSSNALFSHGHADDLPEGVIRLGRVSDGAVAALYSSARALVFPSIYEGFGIPPLEAMMWGCPVIASDIPSSREVCGDAAIFFDPHQARELTECMRRAVDGEIDFRALKAAAAEQVRHFSWDNTAAVLTQASERLLYRKK